MATKPLSPASSNFLISGSDYLAAYKEKHPDFHLIGRKEEMDRLMRGLMIKSEDNNIILTAPKKGVGLSSLIMGLQASKEDPSTPKAIVEKNIFYLDVNALFSLSDPGEILAGFQKAINTLNEYTSKNEDAVLVIENTEGFMNGAITPPLTSLMFTLMEASANEHFQTIFMPPDEELPKLDAMHADVRRLFTTQDVGDPSADELPEIAAAIAKDIARQYDVDVPPEVVKAMLNLTEKFPLQDLPAQPDLSRIILRGAMTAHILSTAQATPSQTAHLEETLEIVKKALESGQPAEGDLADKTSDELEGMRAHAETALEAARATQEQTKAIYDDMELCQKKIREARDAIAAFEEQSRRKNETLKNIHDFTVQIKTADDETKTKIEMNIQAILRNFYRDYKEELPVSMADQFNERADGKKTQWYATEIDEERTKLAQAEKDLATDRENLKNLTPTTDADDDAPAQPDQMTVADVLGEFSRLSKVPMNKLQQNEKERLRNLEHDLNDRVFGQDQAVKGLAEAVRRGRLGLKEPNAPTGNFIFLGPSSVGKSELAKALADWLEAPLHFYDMTEYSEKHAIAKLVGAPPGYAGFDAGGLLINDVRREPFCVNLFDEAEKAHPDTFDVLLRPFRDGELSDSQGRVANFGNTVNILTSNLGGEFFMNIDMSPEDAKKNAMDCVKNFFKPEFLRRCDGIFCFNRLESGQIQLIALRSIEHLNDWLKEKDISVDMPRDDLNAMCEDQYLPTDGASGIKKYIAGTIVSEAANALLETDDEPGVLRISYTPGEVDLDKVRQEIVESYRDELRGGIELAAKHNGDNLEGDELAARVDERLAEKLNEEEAKKEIDARVKEKAKELKKDTGVLDTTFVAGDAAPAAKPAAARVPANDTSAAKAKRAPALATAGS